MPAEATHLDFECRSRVSLPVVGAWRYAMDPSTQITAMSFGTAPGSIQTFNGLKLRFDWSPRNLGVDVSDWASRRVVAHSAPFEYAIFCLILHRRFGWPARWNPQLWGCTQARAAQVGLPLSLEALSKALELKTPKDMEGRRLILQLCQPRADGTFDEDPVKYERMCLANRNDVLTEMEADALLPQLTPHERKIWEHDLVANRRGVAVDLELAEKAGAFAERTTKALNARLLKLTGGGVTKASRVAEIKHWVGAQGLKEFQGADPESLDKVGLFKLLERTDVSEKLKEVIRIRQQVGKSSTAKYRKTLDAAGEDGRVRGVLQYHAAHTGRWGGRLIQPQNYPHGFKPSEQKIAVDLILADDYEGFQARYGEKAMEALANVLRGTIVAAPGKVLVAADLSAIETCVLMVLAGEKEVCEQLRKKQKPYMAMAQEIYRDKTLTKEKNPQAYDLGKRTILGAGFGLGWKTFQLRTYEETAKIGKPIWLDDTLAERAITAYREKYVGVPALWRDVETAVIAAVRNPGTNYASCGGRVIWGMSRDRRFLVAKLPSGRYLWYYKPEIRSVKTPWGAMKDAMCYWGEDPYTKKWSLIKTYGGLLVENIVQAIARDILAWGMLEVQNLPGINAILTVHDEVVGEADEPPGKALSHAELLKVFIAAMCDNLADWMKEYPIGADGWVGYRYHKE